MRDLTRTAGGGRAVQRAQRCCLRDVPGGRDRLAIAHVAFAGDHISLSGARVVANGQFGCCRRGACINNDRALREVAPARGGNSANDLDPFEGTGRNATEVDASARRGRHRRRLTACSDRLQVGVVGERHTIQDNERAGSADISGPRTAQSAGAGGARLRKRT